MQTIGFASITETPDDVVVPEVARIVGDRVRIVERGNLDGLTAAEVDALAPAPGTPGIVAPLKDGTEKLLSHHKIIPRVQTLVDGLVREDGATMVVVLCGADWSQIKTPVPLINPGRVFPAIVTSLATGHRLGVIKPSATQVEQELARYRGLGIDAVVTSATPSGDERLAAVRDAAEQLRDAECDLIWMTCIGMDQTMRDIVSEVTGKPVLFARTMLARVIAELAGGERGQAA
ncbi:MAG: AroM family protein [Chloroflexia bacterium]|nr:AroM family protein [Chloroflexia bacterium]